MSIKEQLKDLFVSGGNLPTCKISDPLHEITSRTLNQYHFAPDLLLSTNALLTIACLMKKDCTWHKIQWIVFISIILFVYSIRQALAHHSSCQIASIHPSRADKRWFVISGHLFASGCLTFLLWTHCPSKKSKYLSLLITLCIGFVSCVTREHHFCDVLVTGFLLLGLGVFLSKFFRSHCPPTPLPLNCM